MTGRYCHVYGTANTWHNYCDQLEDLGCEVVENQTDDYDIQDLGTIDDEIGVVPINKRFNPPRIGGIAQWLNARTSTNG